MKTINIDDEQHKKLKKLKEKTGVPMAESVRRAINRYLSEVATNDRQQNN